MCFAFPIRCLLFVVWCWQPGVYCCLSRDVDGCLLSVVSCFLLVVRCVLSVARCLQLVVCCCLLVVMCCLPLCAVRCVLLVAC